VFFSRAAVKTFLLACLITPAALHAQTNEGILAGTVLDPSGAAIEGVNIAAKNEATAQTLTTTTGPSGAFRFPSLPIGLYDVTASHAGFSSVTQSGVNVQISSTS
jgi:hypothetical protein